MVTGPEAEGTVHTESGSTPTVVGVKSEMSSLSNSSFSKQYPFVNTWRILVAVIAMRMFLDVKNKRLSQHWAQRLTGPGSTTETTVSKHKGI